MNMLTYISKHQIKLCIYLAAFLVFFGVNAPVHADTASSVCEDQAVGSNCSYTPNTTRQNPNPSVRQGVCVRGGGLLGNGKTCGDASQLGTCRQEGDVCTSGGQTGQCQRRNTSQSGRGSTSIQCIVSASAETQGAPNDGGEGAPNDGGDGAPNDGGDGAPNDGGDTTNGGGSPQPQPQSVQFDNPITATSVPELIATIIRGVLGLLGAVAVAIIVYAGFTYMTAGGNASKTAQATTAITNAVIGLVVIMGAFLIVDYVISAIIG